MLIENAWNDSNSFEDRVPEYIILGYPIFWFVTVVCECREGTILIAKVITTKWHAIF